MPIHSRVVTSLLFATSLFLSGCGRNFDRGGPEHTEVRDIDLDTSDEVQVELRMGAGELRVRGGAEKLMEGRFTYNRDRLRPEISYESGSRGHLVVEEPSRVGTATRRYAWDLRFNNQKPLDLEINCGAGESRLNLGDLTLKRVSVEMGVGELRMDLRGTPKNDYDVHVHGGIGEATIYLPEGVGIEADAEGGIGGIHAPGLQKRDGRYVNGSYGHAKTNIRLDVTGGIGAINLIAN